MRFPIRAQIVFTLATTLVATIAATSALAAYLNARRAERLIDDQLERIVSVVQPNTFPLTNSTLQQMNGLSGAEFVLTNQHGDVLAASEHLRVARQVTPVEQQTAPRWGTPVLLAGGRYFQRTLPIQRPDIAGVRLLHILLPEADFQQARREAILSPLAAGLIGSVLAMALATVLSRRIARPTVELAQRMRAISAQGYPQMAVPDRNDELRDLVLAANELSARIADLSATIRRTERLAIVGQLGGAMAHQLRNAAAGARLAVQLHGRDCSDSDPECLQNAVRQLDLIEEQVASLLALGKRGPAKFEPVDIEQVAANVMDLVGPTCHHREVSLTMTAEHDSILVQGDRSQLRNLLLNLVWNAIDAAREQVRIELQADATRGLARIVVVDDGPGVPDAIADHLYEPFVTSKPEGIGLGLTLTRQTAEAHGGSICHQRTAHETRFLVELPLSASVSAEHNTMLVAGSASTEG